MQSKNQTSKFLRGACLTVFSLSPLYLLFSFLGAQELTTYEIDTVFVTASRVSNNRYSLPISTNLISEEKIRLRSLGDISLLLQNEAGIDIRNYSLLKGATSLSLFGSSSQQVLVLIDGIPFYSPSLGVSDLGLIPVSALKRIEVVKGPISSLYGANALGGVINFITKSPLDWERELILDANLLYGSFRTSNFSLLSGFNKNKKMGLLFSLHQEKSLGTRSNEDALTRGVSVNGSYLDNLAITLNYETKSLGLPGPKPAFPPLYGDSTATSLYDRQFDNLYRISGELNLPLTEILEISARPFFIFNKTDFLWVDAYSLDTTLYEDHYQTKTIGGNLIVNLDTRIGRFVSGIDFRSDDFWAHSYFYDLTTFKYKDTIWNPTSEKIGLFTEGHFRIPFSLIPSLRYDWDSKYGSFLSPSLGILFPVFRIPYSAFRIHLGQAFRAPTFNDQYWPRSGNPQIKPEKGYTIQFGFDSPNLFTGTLFIRKTQDLISWVPDKGTWRPTNIDRQEVFGFESKFSFRILDFEFNIAGDLKKATQIRKEVVYYDWATGEPRFETKRRRAAFLPQFNLYPSLNLLLGSTTFNLETRLTGDKVNYYSSYDSLPKVTMETKTLPAYFTASLRAEQRIREKIFLTFKVENLFNTDYSEQFGNSIDDKDYPRPKRSLFFGIRVKN